MVRKICLKEDNTFRYVKGGAEGESIICPLMHTQENVLSDCTFRCALCAQADKKIFCASAGDKNLILIGELC